MNHAFEFYKTTTDYLGAFWHESAGSLMFMKTLMAYDESGDFTKTGARAGVWFDPRELQTVTGLWVKLASQVGA